MPLALAVRPPRTSACGENHPHAGRRLDQVDSMAREASALALEPGSFDVPLAAALADDGRQLVERARRARERLVRTRDESSHLVQEAARALHAKGLPTRDVGVLLGLSHQRVAQVISR